MYMHANRNHLGVLTQMSAGDDIWSVSAIPSHAVVNDSNRKNALNTACVVNGLHVFICSYPHVRSLHVLLADNTFPCSTVKQFAHTVAQHAIPDVPPFINNAVKRQELETTLTHMVHIAVCDLIDMLGP